MGVSLLDGWLPWLLRILAIAAAGFLLARRERWWWLAVVPTALVLSGVGAWIFGTYLSRSLLSQELQFSDRVWIGIGLAGIMLAAASMVRTPWWRKLVSILAALVIVAMAGNQINQSYTEFPRLGDLFGPTSDSEINGPPAVSSVPSSALPTSPLTGTWTPTGADIPTDGGKVSLMTIPGTVSGFPARQGYVYLPPAYFADNAVPLPVLVLLHGQPGGPGDWILGDRLPAVMNAYAAEHNGIAPIVVMPDVTGGEVSNPLCLDSALGKVDTYVATDVPNAIKAQLRADPRPQKWAVGGFSYGGTCSMQMATNHPDIYPTFLDFAGELEPTLGSRSDTVAQAFSGDETKFKAVNAMDLLATKKFTGSAGWFVVGDEDPLMLDGMEKLYEAAGAAGMDVQLWQVPGVGHAWELPVAGLTHVMPWLGQRLGITDAATDASASPSVGAPASSPASPSATPTS